MTFSFYLNKQLITWTALILVVCTPGLSKARTTGVLLSDDQAKTLYAHNADKLFIPASITKILTSTFVLETLSPGYRFETWVGYNPLNFDLYIKGFGDPLFISEQIQELVAKIIHITQTRSFRNIILDHGFFHPDISIPGTGKTKNPYDATTGALCANFNTLFCKWDKAENRFVSAEPQTPMLDIFKDEIKISGQTHGRILLSKHQRRLYPGLLIKAFLENKNIGVTGIVKEGACPDEPGIKFRFKSSFSLNQVIEKLLKFSNNFMANQLMLTMGAMEYGAPATLEKGVAHLKQFAEKKLGLKEFFLVEGSGLSRQNQFSPRQMLKILMAFMPHHSLMKKQGNQFYKTGTLSDVRTRAGYFVGEDARLYPFVIMINQTTTGYTDILRKLKNIVSGVSNNH